MATAEDTSFEVRDKVASFATFDDYLASLVTDADRAFLDSEELARSLVSLGLRGGSEVLTRPEFDARKKADREKHLHKDLVPKPLASVGKDLSGMVLLQALAAREELVRNGKVTCIVYVRDFNAKGQEVSGYIDFLARLRAEPFEPYFDGSKKFLPKPSDLAFYNWATQSSTSNSTTQFQVIADNDTGLLFKNKRDRKVINVDPEASPGDNTTRTEVRCPHYAACVIYDHYTRRRV